MEKLITELIDGCLQQFKDNHYTRLSLDKSETKNQRMKLYVFEANFGNSC